ncbi:amidohydrolase [Desulfopila sp. IMCC35006]|uniref:amidohydrolase family protein n=1 Tax=Desulfopila sp. IMCC35006 TaxID=2569542 RepID=UPI0010AB9347|nr:amidohydrolase family protein [Desulfopila sp. IMCC35006]TKB23876.1 amidohydrolase [Desulfopila sp. IMCC35006]
MTLYLKDAQFIDWQNLVIHLTHLAVASGPKGTVSKISSLPAGDALAADDRIVDCKGKFVTKSFGCGHHHIYSTLARGMPAPRKIPTNFPEILEYVWWNIDKQLDLEMIEASALASAIYCAKSGVTFVIDHHASPFAIEGSLETIARAFDRVGIAHMLCYEMSDRDGAEIREQGLAETEAFLASGRAGHVGLHASFTVGEQLLEEAVALAGKHQTGLHIHVAEDFSDQQHCQTNFGKRVVERLYGAGALQLNKSILAHCIHLSDRERELLQQSGVWVVQNVESNQNNNVGLGRYGDLQSRMMLGTDGMHCDMLRSAKAAFLSGQATEGIGFDTIYDRFRNVHRYIEATGTTGDGDNNLVVLDYDPPTDLTQDNFLGHFVFGIDTRHVESVIAQGRLLVEDRRIQTVDEKEVLSQARAMGRKLWAKL